MADQQFDPKEFQKQTQETLSVIQDTLTSFAANLATAMKQSIRETGDEAEKVIKKNINTDLTRAFREVTKEVDKMATANDRFVKGLETTASLKRKRIALEEKLSKLERKRAEAQKYGIELTEEELEYYYDIKEQVEDIYKVQEDQAKKLEKKVLGLVGVFDRFAKIPIAGQLLNSAEASEAMKKSLLEGGSSMQAFGKGIKAAFAGIEKASVVLFLANKLVQAIRFVADMFILSQESSVSLAQVMGTTVTVGERLKKTFNAAGTSIYHNFQAVEKAMQGIKTQFGLVSVVSEDVIRNATFLTERLGLSGEEAAKLNLIFSSFGKNAESSTEAVNKLVRNFAEANGAAVPLDIVMKDINDAGEEIAGYFGFSAEALATAALKTRQFGLALQNTKNISSGLLDFEKSISSELQLRLLTGQEINLNEARNLALQGDVAGATASVLKQMEKIPIAQRKNPIIMKEMAEAAGLSADELNRAFLLTQNTTQALKYQKDEYQRLLDTQGKEAAERFREQTKLTQADIKGIKARVPITKQLSDALTKMQETVSTLFPADLVQKFVKAIEDFTMAVSGFLSRVDAVGFGAALTGAGGPEAAFEEFNKVLKATSGDGDSVAKRSAAAKKLLIAIDKELQSPDFLDKINFYRRLKLKEQRETAQSFIVDDFTLRTNPKDTLVMAGGTKFGEETNALLRELITAVKSGGHVYIDGRKVGESLALGTGKS